MFVDWPTKDPDEVLDYGLDWSDDMAADADDIASSVWTISKGDSALIIDSTSFSVAGHITTAWLSGGTVGNTYQLTNTITTSGGRTYERTAEITVREK